MASGLSPSERGGAIVLVGFMGAGKTTSARSLARSTKLRALDADRELEKHLRCTISEAFARDGEAAFRVREEQVVCALLRRARKGEVISLGGGALAAASVRDALREHIVVWLDIDAESAWGRIANGKRPLARNREEFFARHRERAPLYGAVADVIVATNERDAVRQALPSIEQLRRTPSGTRLLWAYGAGWRYPVWVGRGLLADAPWPLDRTDSRRYLVSDEHVVAKWGAALGPLDGSYVIAAGEEHKTLAAAESVWQALAQDGVRRSDHIVALGGGVVGDLAGFCAATYQRGVPVVQVPTTVVAQVDSAYGGKTAVDLPQAKNYVGAYHQPAAVIADLDTLATLPAAEHAAGYAEVLKTALIAGGPLWARVAADEPVDQQTVWECARTKLAVVAADERDDGVRQTLNLGHTVGHAIESATGYRRYRHGEAVALGLLAALRLSGQDALRVQVSELFAAHGLPLQAPGLDAASVVAHTRRDKKRVGDAVPFVLLDAPGSVRHGASVDEGAIEAAVRELCV